MNGHTYRLIPIFSEKAIAARVQEIAEEINRLYLNEPVVVICVLKGGFMFFADLVKYITIKPELEFVRLSSYGLGTESKGIGFTKDVELSLENKHVLLVEDVVDTGYSMQFLIRQLQSRGVKSLRLAALIDKRERRKVDVTVDFAGFQLDEGFIVGYGLDFAERHRELPAIYKVVFDK